MVGFCGGMTAIARQKVRRMLGDRTLTLADAHGLAIMTDRHSAVCWSTDRHLGLTGVDLAIAFVN